MDVVLRFLDKHILDAAYAHVVPLRVAVDGATIHDAAIGHLGKAASGAVKDDWAWQTVSALPRDNIWRQLISLFVIVQVGILLLYFIVATFSYYVLFDHRMMQHPRFLKRQVRQEIMCSLNAFPWLNLLNLPWFLAEVRGWTSQYERLEDGPVGAGWKAWAYMGFVTTFFLIFTDFCIYWVHRLEHHPSVYKYLHKRHHKWVIPTPFSAYAFHPMDGYLQELPYHICAHFMFPMQKYLFMGLFVAINLWTIAIHDSDMIVDHPLEKIVNGPAHHTLHHMHFTCNYGQYFTWSDRWGGSYRHPAKGDDPLLEVLAAQEQKRKASSSLASPQLASRTMSSNSSATSEEGGPDTPGDSDVEIEGKLKTL